MPAGAADPAWSDLARSDLAAMHDAIRDNHPGPVDPENGRYREWLEAGLRQATERAAGVRSYFDYVRALRFYANGFQDGHIGLGLEITPYEQAWPGFIAGNSRNGAAEVIWARPDAGVRVGDQIIDCDGRSIDDWMTQRIDPYFWNRAIPHQRFEHVYRLFYTGLADRSSQFSSCRFSSGRVELGWRSVGRGEFQGILEEAGSQTDWQPSLRQAGELWIARIPTFSYSDDDAVAAIGAFLAELQARAADLRGSTIVLDVRGNSGGNSAWGEEVAKAIWGPELVQRVADSFDETVDWRASDRNIEYLSRILVRVTAEGLPDSVDYYRRALEAMKAARTENRPLARQEDRGSPIGAQPPGLLKGRVLFLTDGDCASACLDFADLVLRLPRSTQVGLPTSADAVYIDNTRAELPSGLSSLSYSMKVYRNRARGNNEWYEPSIRWPGGAMTEESLVTWLTGLAADDATPASPARTR
jgi:Peptidase family S41